MNTIDLFDIHFHFKYINFNFTKVQSKLNLTERVYKNVKNLKYAI